MPKRGSSGKTSVPLPPEGLRSLPPVEDIPPWLRDILLRTIVFSKTPEDTSAVFTDAQWQSISAIRKDRSKDINWQKARERTEAAGRFFLWMRRSKSQLGTPAKVRATLKGLLRQTRKLQGGLQDAHALADFRDHHKSLADLEQDLQNWILIHGASTPREDFGRDWLYVWLLNVWVGPLRGELSFSRKPDNTPYGPLIDFLTLTIKIIAGRAPGPHGLAKIIDQHRKSGDLPL